MTEYNRLFKEELGITTSWEREAAQKTREEIALKLIKMGMVVNEIAQVTGLGVEEVQQLEAKLQKEN